MARLLRFAAIAVATLVFPASALAGAFTLHPSGFGEHSYSAWKANQGLPDSTGNKDQAPYFQKMTLTPTFAAGVAVIKGFEGQATSVLAPLSFYWREDGHCGAGAPRFNVRFQPQGTQRSASQADRVRRLPRDDSDRRSDGFVPASMAAAHT